METGSAKAGPLQKTYHKDASHERRNMKTNRISEAVQKAESLMKSGATFAHALTETNLTPTQFHQHSKVPRVTTAHGAKIKARTHTLAQQAAQLIRQGMTRGAALRNAGISDSSYKRAGVGPSKPEPVLIGEKRMRGVTVEKAREAKRLIDAGLPVLKACDRAGLSQTSYRVVYSKPPPVADVRAFLDAVAKTKREAA